MANKSDRGEYQAQAYAKFRPSPPSQIIDKIISYLKEKFTGSLSLAVDIGCGTGQSTVVLAPYFEKVVGFDVSETQVKEAGLHFKKPNITYRVGPAEKIDIEDGSAQLITAAEACHWFDLPKFYAEARRILAPKGVLALYAYRVPRPLYKDKSDDLWNIVNKLFAETFSECWSPGKELVDDGYAAITMPFEDNERVDSIYVEVPATVAEMVGNIKSWSAFEKYRKLHGEEKANNLAESIEKDLMNVIGTKNSPSETEISMQYEFFLLLGRKQ